MTRRRLTGQAWLAVHAPPPGLLMLMANGAQFIGTVPTVEGRQPAVACLSVLCHSRSIPPWPSEQYVLSSRHALWYQGTSAPARTAQVTSESIAMAYVIAEPCIGVK